MTQAAAGGRDDTRRTLTAVVAFGFALGASGVVFPLLALDHGIAPTVVGLLVAASGATHLASRLVLPWLLARLPDRVLMVIAAASLAASAAVLLDGVSLATFIAAQALNGFARALFWTSNQTHLVRGPGVPIRRLAQAQMASHIGALAGPALAGVLLAVSAPLALGVVTGAGGVAAIVSTTLVRRPPYERRTAGTRRQLRRQRSIALGCWTSFSAGGWRGILDSFVPIVLAAAGLGPASVGWLVAVAEAATVAASAWLARFGHERFAVPVRIAAGSVLLGAAVLPLVADRPVLAAIALAAAGAGGGLAGALGPAIVNANVEQRQQGTAIALAGTYRAASRLTTPAIIAGASGVIGIPVTLGLAAASVVAPMLVLNRGGTPRNL
nr:MFS transporter [Micromonospora sp. DSM 115978]